MVGLAAGTFRSVLLTPGGKLLDCRAGSVLLPVHDGLMGVLRNHAPMLCKLGLGIMQVKNIPDRDDAFFLIDGGFARISENHVTVLAYDVMTFEEMGLHEAETIVAKAKEIVIASGYYSTQTGQEVDIERARLVVKLGALSSVLAEDLA
jgi:F-type H+-transporting ATPase subunit epsilon